MAGEDCKLIIGSGNTIREYCTINRGTKAGGSATQVGNNNWIMAYVHIAHDCTIGNDNIMSNATSLAGHVTIGNNVVLAGYVLIHQFCRVGDFLIRWYGCCVESRLTSLFISDRKFC